MAAHSLLLVRIRRVFRIFDETHQQTGSRLLALTYTCRFVVVKLPLLFRQISQVARRRTAIRKIGIAREDLEDATPFIGLRVSGGLGDYLVIARFLRDLRSFAGNFTFDIY